MTPKPCLTVSIHCPALGSAFNAPAKVPITRKSSPSPHAKVKRRVKPLTSEPICATQVRRTTRTGPTHGEATIPVIAPIARGRDGETYNINADTMAGAIASALGAARLFMLTDVPGVLDKEKNLLTDLTPASIEKLQQDGTISGGMIPKLETCIHAVEAGCEAAVVLDGRVPHAMLLEIFTSRGAGTLIRAG